MAAKTRGIDTERNYVTVTVAYAVVKVVMCSRGGSASEA